MRRTTAICLLTTTLAGCSFNESSTRIRSLPEPPSEHLRLQRSDATAISGTFRQDGHAVVGELAFTTDCVNERSELIRRQRVTETHTKRSTTVTWAVIGGVLAAVGTGFLVASQSADKRVTCGNGTSVMDGDQCHSVSGAESEAGLTILLTGAVMASSAAIFALRKPSTEITDLPAEQRQQLTAPVACGVTPALEGLTVALELPQSGKWTGRVGGDGTVRIDVNEHIVLPEHATLSVVVDSVPPSIAGLIAPGAAIGAVTLAAPAESARRHVASHH
jgi:hypothetical protein